MAAVKFLTGMAGLARDCARRRGGIDQILDASMQTVAAIMCRLPHKESHMATNLAIDPDLLDRAVRVSGEKTKKAVVTKALQEFIARREQRRVVELIGTLDWDESFDYKADRSRS